MNPGEFAEAVSDPIQSLGALHYFGPEAKKAAQDLGIDLFRFYFAGRGGVLGDVSSEVVQAAFGYFNPSLLNKMWTTAKERCDVTEVAAAQLGVAYQFGETNLAEIEGLTEATESMAKLSSAVDIGGLAMFAGFRSAPIPQSTPSAFMHQVILWRELRGSVHLAAIAATGCPTRAAHQIRRPDDLEMFGYTEPAEITNAYRSAYAKVEPLTKEAMAMHAEVWLSAPERSQIAQTVDAAMLTLG